MNAPAARSTFIIVLFLGLFAMAARNADDPDLWWHLKTGELIAAHRSVPHTDSFSYTRFGQPWVAHEWLSELGMYELYRCSGFSGLIPAFAAILTAAFVLLYLRCGAAPYVAGILTLWGALATRPVWGVRPQVVSLFLTSLWLVILERSDENQKFLWWTLPITVLWVNLHAGFALGLGIFALFLCGSAVEAALGRLSLAAPTSRKRGEKWGTPDRTSDRSWLTPALIFVFDLLLVPLNPNGARMYFYPIETLRSAAMQNSIAEWGSPNFHGGEYWPFLLLVLAMFPVLARSRIPVRARDLILLTVSLFASLNSIRMIPFFVLIAVPAISRRLGAWPETSAALPGKRWQPAINSLIILAMAGFAALHIVQVIQRQPAIEAGKFPSRAVAFFRAHPPEGHIFNHYDWGGYLIWKLYPSVPVFIDGRADLYGEQLFHDFADAYQLKDRWEQILRRWQVQTVIVPPDSALAIGLQANRGWSIDYRDPQATVFTALRENGESHASSGVCLSLVLGQFDRRARSAWEIPPAAGENAAVRNDAMRPRHSQGQLHHHLCRWTEVTRVCN